MRSEYTNLLALFAIHFSPQLWPLVQVLVTGAILARGQRTGTAILRVMGLSAGKHFVNYHRVLHRARWSSYALSQTLLRLLVTTFVPADLYDFDQTPWPCRISTGWEGCLL